MGPATPLFMTPGAPKLQFSIYMTQDTGHIYYLPNFSSLVLLVLEKKSKIGFRGGPATPLFMTPGAPKLQFRIYMTQGTYSPNLSSLVLLVREKKSKVGLRGGVGHALIYDPGGTKVTI